MSAPPTPPERPDYEEVARASAAAIAAAVIEVLRALREEVERLQDGAEAFVGRVKGAIARSLHALQRAVLATFLALVFVAIGGVVLSIFLVALLNRYLGDPWGTGVAALALLVAALVFWARARANFRAMEREAQAMTARAPRGR